MIVRDPSPSSSASPNQSAESKATIGDQVSDLFKQLSVAALDLNSASDELGKCVTALDAVLKTLNLGIAAWVRVMEYGDRSGDFRIHKLGYAKIGGRWGIALRTVEGNENWPEESEREQWLFNDAPRALRIEAVDKLPELLAELIKEATTTSQKIREKTSQARQLAATINRTAEELTPKRK
jgi:hypothetical protein